MQHLNYLVLFENTSKYYVKIYMEKTFLSKLTTQTFNKKRVSFSDSEGEPFIDTLAATTSESSPETGQPTSGNRTTHTQVLNRNTRGFNKK